MEPPSPVASSSTVSGAPLSPSEDATKETKEDDAEYCAEEETSSDEESEKWQKVTRGYLERNLREHISEAREKGGPVTSIDMPAKRKRRLTEVRKSGEVDQESDLVVSEDSQDKSKETQLPKKRKLELTESGKQGAKNTQEAATSKETESQKQKQRQFILTQADKNKPGAKNQWEEVDDQNRIPVKWIPEGSVRISAVPEDDQDTDTAEATERPRKRFFISVEDKQDAVEHTKQILDIAQEPEAIGFLVALTAHGGGEGSRTLGDSDAAIQPKKSRKRHSEDTVEWKPESIMEEEEDTAASKETAN